MVIRMHTARRMDQFISSCIRVLMGSKVRSCFAFIRLLNEICTIRTLGRCPFCGHKAHNLYGHIYLAHKDVVYTICEDLYNTMNKIDEYIKELKGRYSSNYRCLLCGYQADSKESMYRHMILNHFFDDICKEYKFIFDCSRLASSEGL